MSLTETEADTKQHFVPKIYGFKVHIPKRKSPPTPRQASADTQGDDPAAGEKMVQDTKTKEAEEEVVGDDAK